MLSCSNEIRVFIRQVENSLCNPKNDLEILSIFEDIQCLVLPDSSKELKTVTFSNLHDASVCLLKDFYLSLLKTVLKFLTGDTITLVPGSNLNHFLEVIFQQGNAQDCFLSLSWGLSEFRPSYRLNKCVSLLENSLKTHLIQKIVQNQCTVKSHVEQTYIWDELIVSIASLPDRAANKLQSQNSEIFYPKAYISLVGTDILTVLTSIQAKVREGQDVSLEFISRLIGKLCITGYSDILLEVLVGALIPLVRDDFIWCRISERIITGVPDRCLETVLLALINKLPWYGLMEKFLSDSVLKKQKLQYLLCTKVLLFRHSEQVHVLQNVIGYLGSSHTRKHLLIKAFKELLGVWGDTSAIRHTSPEQHLYITKALFICMGFLTEKDKKTYKEEFLRLIMPGVQAHIGSSDQKIRQQGMVLAETLISVIDPNGPKLKFEYEKDDVTESLLKLASPPPDPGIEQIQQVLSSISIDQTEPQQIQEKPLTTPDDKGSTQVEVDLDSDDDLVPYDMSNDIKVTKVKQPKYIRDCMEGLICNDDAERTDVCLQSTEALIRKQADGIDEIAAEFAKILLHIGDKYSTPGFTQLRFKSLVALAVCVPKQVADYLTREFYDRNYNLRQRMDILEVLASAAQELSQPPEQESSKEPQKKVAEVPEETWQSIVQKRIETKTKRFSKGKTKPEPKQAVNRFSPVAGHFFYPLMTRFDRKENTFDMLGEDSLVLGRLIYTLGVVMYSAINSPNIKQMGTVLLEFLWVLRFHQDPSVRHSILFSLSMVMLAVPGHILLSELQVEILESKQWLEDIVQKDPDTESKKLALQCLVLLENIIKQEFTGDEQLQ